MTGQGWANAIRNELACKVCLCASLCICLRICVSLLGCVSLFVTLLVVKVSVILIVV